jgi:hypothetical protein
MLGVEGVEDEELRIGGDAVERVVEGKNSAAAGFNLEVRVWYLWGVVYAEDEIGE